MKRTVVMALALATAAPAAAQEMQPAARGTGNAAVSASKAVWQTMTAFVVRAAEQMPEEDYGFRPTESVRTFGQLVGHVAGAQYMICAVILGEAPRPENNIEQTRTTKAELVQALRESTEYCDRAYAQSDADARGTINLFGQEQTRMQALNLNAAHNAEHYGNMVTYLRIRGMVPPSSQPRN